jgi:hypothetical protein
MAEKKSILEEALLDINNITNALNANTKEILRSVAKEEIDSVVKESLKEEAYTEEEVENLDETSHAEHEAGESKEEEEAEHKKGEEKKDEVNESEEEEMNEGMYEEEGLELEDEMGMGDETPEELDMTGASDDDVIAIYKKLSGDDEIEIVGDELHLNITEPGEYVVKLDSLDDVDVDDEIGAEEEPIELGADTDDEDEVEYDIEMGDESEEDEEEFNDDFSDEEDETEDEIIDGNEEEDEDELEETRYVGGKVQKVATAHTNAKLEKESLQEVQKAKQIVSETAKKYNSLLTEATKLKAENEEFRKALKEFRTKLVETVVFNSNLTYVTKLFMEHSTTKAEKQSIIKRFDEEVTNLKESKKLYKTIANELETRKPIAESVENKIIKESASSVSKQLNESTAYVDPSTKRIMDLIKRVENK